MPKFLMASLFVLLLAPAGSGQEIPALSITPSKATVVVGDVRPFRAVNREGHPALSVRWSSNSSDAVISGNGAEIEVNFRRPGDYVIHAYGKDGSADSATVRVISGYTLPEGTTKWSVQSFDGCHTKKIVPAIPAPGSTNDLFMQEECPKGEMVRALTAEGLENWRTWVTGKGADKDIDPETLQEAVSTPLSKASVCDGIRVGMSREDAAKIVAQAKLDSAGFDKPSDLWSLEEGAGECRITFRDDKVIKKQKVIGN